MEENIVLFLSEAISKTEKWFEVKPPAPLPARRAYRPEGRAYAPEGTVQYGEESRPQVGTSSKPSS
jgi:hypothetical protein